MPRLDTDIIMTDLTRQLEAAGMSDHPLVVWVRPNGSIQIAYPGIGRAPGRRVDEERIAFAARMVQRVNQEAWCDGIWLAVWANWALQPEGDAGLLVPVPTEFMLMFKDSDGDDQITVANDEAWAIMKGFSVDKMINDCLEAVKVYRNTLAAAGVKRENMRSPAKGQALVGAPE